MQKREADSSAALRNDKQKDNGKAKAGPPLCEG
jgi:hypothetical protein